LDAPEERLEGAVEAGEQVLQDLGMDGAVLGPHLFDIGQLGVLASEGDAHAALLPRFFAFLQGGVVELAAAAYDNSIACSWSGVGVSLYLNVLRRWRPWRFNSSIVIYSA
jgi:hypothetical protein